MFIQFRAPRGHHMWYSSSISDTLGLGGLYLTCNNGVTLILMSIDRVHNVRFVM